jgi:hypothetical protein
MYNTTPLTELKAFSKSIRNWCTVPLYSYFFKSICQMPNVWTIVDLLRRNPYWRPPVISSTYGINLGRRILDKILYVVGKSNIPP